MNERDGLGDELVPDYLTSVREGAFYGWPYSYFGQHEEPRQRGRRPDLVAEAVAPDYGLGSHTASLSLAFYRGETFPEPWRSGAFVGQHGSWNRSSLTGYRVLFVPFEGGRPAGPPREFLGGFIADSASFEVHGRPLGVAVASRRGPAGGGRSVGNHLESGVPRGPADPRPAGGGAARRPSGSPR